MGNKNGKDIYYRGNDLMDASKSEIFLKICALIEEEQGEIAELLWYKDEMSKQYMELNNKKQWIITHNKDAKQEIDILDHQCKIINITQGKILLAIQPKFDEIFMKVASTVGGGIGYNKTFQKDIWFDLIFGHQKIAGSGGQSNDNYRSNLRSSLKNNQDDQTKQQKKVNKVFLPHNHKLLKEETYPKIKKILMIHLDNVVNTYEQKFLKDTKDLSHIQGLIDNYFVFIFIQTLIQSKLIFDIKKPKATVFFQQVMDDCLVYIQKKYGIVLTINANDSKKKVFTTTNKENKPLELMYQNCIEEDILSWENYFNDVFLTPNDTSVEKIRKEIMIRRKKNTNKIPLTFQLMNPLYHSAKEKKEKILTTIKILEPHISENTLIADIIKQLQGSLKKIEEDIKNNVVFEEDPVQAKELESITKIQQQYLRFYKVPVQYRKLFGIVINRLNNVYQIKGILYNEAKKINNQAFNNLVCSSQDGDNILLYIRGIVTQKMLVSRFEEKWQKKQQEKVDKIKHLCLHQNTISPSKKNHQNTTGQTVLDI